MHYTIFRHMSIIYVWSYTLIRQEIIIVIAYTCNLCAFVWCSLDISIEKTDETSTKPMWA